MTERRKPIHPSIDDVNLTPEVKKALKEIIAQTSGARKVRELTQKEICKRSGVGESTWNRVENFQGVNVQVTVFLKVLDAMGLKLAIVPKSVDSEMIMKANAMLLQYMQTMQGHFVKPTHEDRVLELTDEEKSRIKVEDIPEYELSPMEEDGNE